MSFTYSQETFSPITATGGTVYDITIDGASYRVHEFTSGTSSFIVSSLGTGLHPFLPGNSANSIEYLVVAGGGGGTYLGGTAGTGGSGIGGDGNTRTNGQTNTGSGGGAAGNNTGSRAGSGGSGIVIIRYPIM